MPDSDYQEFLTRGSQLYVGNEHIEDCYLYRYQNEFATVKGRILNRVGGLILWESDRNYRYICLDKDIMARDVFDGSTLRPWIEV